MRGSDDTSWFATILAGLVLGFIPNSVSAQDNWTVPIQQANCLLENLWLYQSSDNDPIVVFLTVCPTVDRLEAMSKLQQNNGSLPAGPSVVVLEDGSERLADEVLVYTRDELLCLEELEVDLAATYALLPKDPCAP